MTELDQAGADLAAALLDSATYLKAHLQHRDDGTAILIIDEDERDVVVKKWVRLVMAASKAMMAEDAAQAAGETRQ